mgnify:FL=1
MNVPRPDSLVQHYLLLSDLSDQMLTAAQEKAWLTLLALGRRYTESLEALRNVNRSESLTNEEKELRYRLLLRIIDNDARIRRLVLPADAQLDRLMGATGTLPGAFGLETTSP